MFDLNGRRALVTGASGGIGGAIARVLHAQGAAVAVSGTRVDALERLAAELGERVAVAPCDLADAAATSALVGRAQEALGGLDILVNNAGLTKDNLAMMIRDEAWSQVIEVNLTSAFRLSREALKLMTRARWGRIINITSVVGVTGNAGQANYAASKAGMIGMTKSMAAEVAKRGVTVNCVAPGFVKTAMTDALNDKQREMLLALIPAARLGTGHDVAGAVAFLASEEAAYITGQTLHVNGGMAMI